eukprot:SAG11_NODE_1350_length_5137_cov_2.743152_2_plen_62_part_00
MRSTCSEFRCVGNFQVMKEIDTNADGSISFEELFAWWSHPEKPSAAVFVGLQRLRFHATFC